MSPRGNVLSRIWTLLFDSIFYDDNLCNKWPFCNIGFHNNQFKIKKLKDKRESSNGHAHKRIHFDIDWQFLTFFFFFFLRRRGFFIILWCPAVKISVIANGNEAKRSEQKQKQSKTKTENKNELDKFFLCSILI